MLVTTDAIVLLLQPQSDKAFTLHAYTRMYGRVNYKVYGLGRRHAIGLYTPLSLLRITADHSPSKPPTLKEATRVTTPQVNDIDTNIRKQTVVLFISEILYNVLRHPMQDEPMFDFLVEAITNLQSPEANLQSSISNFHLHFLVDFAAKLGFAIPENQSPMSNIQYPISNVQTPITRQARQQALRALCDYFAEHVETWQHPKSLDVLIEVFD